MATASLSVLGASLQAPARTMTQHQFIRSVQRSPLDRFLSGPGREAVRILTGTRGRTSSGGARSRRAEPAPRDTPQPAPPNVRVNDPSTDGAGNPDMTQQNEVSVAVSGSNVVAGYNDDGTSPPPIGQAPSPATDITGYSWSDDGGGTWHDSELPNASPSINSGDPVVAADRGGHFFFAELSLNFSQQRIDVSVARSDDGGRTFAKPTVLSSRRKLTMSDKPWMAIGPNPANPSTDVVYVAWQDSFFDQRSGAIGTRIMVRSSADGGASWSPSVQVFKQPAAVGKTSAYVNGSSLAVDPATGRVYLAWEQFVEPRHGGGRFAIRREFVTHSDDRGQTFARPMVMASPGPVGVFQPACGNAMKFGPGRLVRIQEFPSLGIGPGGQVLVAYDSADRSGMAGVLVARSLDGGATWTSVTVAGPPDAFMPALSADSTGVSVAYYQRVSATLLKTAIATSADGTTFTTQDLSSASFPVDITFPNYDPATAPCYMGDYVGVLRQAGSTYTGWGDNRDVVVNSFWPDGRPDPDVFFSKL